MSPVGSKKRGPVKPQLKLAGAQKLKGVPGSKKSQSAPRLGVKPIRAKPQKPKKKRPIIRNRGI